MQIIAQFQLDKSSQFYSEWRASDFSDLYEIAGRLSDIRPGMNRVSNWDASLSRFNFRRPQCFSFDESYSGIGFAPCSDVGAYQVIDPWEGASCV